MASLLVTVVLVVYWILGDKSLSPWILVPAMMLDGVILYVVETFSKKAE